VAVTTGLTPLVGREREMGLLRERWEQTKAGEGQVVLLSGEAGIGKSRLAQELKEQAVQEGATRIEFRCSPYYQHTALYPILEHLQRFLQFQRQDTPHTRLDKLVKVLSSYRFPQADTVPLLAALLSLPHPEGYAPLTLSPQRQKRKTHEALVIWVLEEAERQSVYCTWEDLHWADPTTLDILHLYLERVPTAPMLAVLTFRPEFQPPWRLPSPLSQITVGRLGRKHVEMMTEKVTGGKSLPAEVLQQIVSKTDGVPLFVEELTRMVLESGLVRAAHGRYELIEPLPPLAIPATLHDSLMARLDRLAPVREIAQLGATLGREFRYEVMQAVCPLDEETLQQGLTRLVEAELVSQRGELPQARYIFKHTLVQETAYQSLLKSKRQHYHQQIARVLEERFPDTRDTQPELIARHYTEAGLIHQAIAYWQRAGQRANKRSAYAEAISHLTRGIGLLMTLPDTSERARTELGLQLILGAALMATQGYAAPAVEQTYGRARALCQQLGETPQLFPVFIGLHAFHTVRGDLQQGQTYAEQCLRLARRVQDPALLLAAHAYLGHSLYYLGEFGMARDHIQEAIALHDPHRHYAHALLYEVDPGVTAESTAAWTLHALGHPDQAIRRSREAVAVARQLSHAHSLAYALAYAALLRGQRREGQAAQEQAEATMALAAEQGLVLWLALGTFYRGWALAQQGLYGEGITLMRQGQRHYQATGAQLGSSVTLCILAETCGQAGQAEAGLRVIETAFAVASRNGELAWEAELWRGKGELLCRLAPASDSPFSGISPEACFLKAIDIAHQRHAKYWELRAATSLARLWQHQGKRQASCDLLAPLYSWFTEGFDTADLQEARTLLEALT
jgi:predicted ATPase